MLKSLHFDDLIPSVSIFYTYRITRPLSISNVNLRLFQRKQSHYAHVRSTDIVRLFWVRTTCYGWCWEQAITVHHPCKRFPRGNTDTPFYENFRRAMFGNSDSKWNEFDVDTNRRWVSEFYNRLVVCCRKALLRLLCYLRV